MLYKAGVKLDGVREQTWYAIGVFEALYWSRGYELVVTSLTDGVHPDAINIHGNGFAADLRTRELTPAILQNITNAAKALLEPLGYEVVVESDHIHVQWNPKVEGKSWWQVLDGTEPKGFQEPTPTQVFEASKVKPNAV